MKDSCLACPIARVAKLLSDSWTLLIVRDLLSGPKRFNELTESLSGVSTRTLSVKLKRLVDMKIIEKLPGYDGYKITKKGSGLGKIMDDMAEYGMKNL